MITVTGNEEDISQCIVDATNEAIDSNTTLADAIVGDEENEVTKIGGEENDVIDDAIVDIGPVATMESAHEAFDETIADESAPKTSYGGETSEHHECSECKRVTTGGGQENADNRCIVGGVEFGVGGWGEYMINSRNARFVHGGAVEEIYHDRREISGGDVVDAVMCARTGGEQSLGPLKAALLHLSKALGRMEDRLCDPSGEGIWECLPPDSLTDDSKDAPKVLMVPNVTSDDADTLMNDSKALGDPEALAEIVDQAGIVAATLGSILEPLPLFRDGGPPPLPTRLVQVSNTQAVLKLEASAAPYIASLEKYQAVVATRLDEIAEIIEKALGKKKK